MKLNEFNVYLTVSSGNPVLEIQKFFFVQLSATRPEIDQSLYKREVYIQRTVKAADDNTDNSNRDVHMYDILVNKQ